jgi:hypothetical protein
MREWTTSSPGKTEDRRAKNLPRLRVEEHFHEALRLPFSRPRDFPASLTFPINPAAAALARRSHRCRKIMLLRES